MRVTYSISARARVYTVVFKTTLPGIKCGTWLKPFIPLSFDLMFMNPSLGGGGGGGGQSSSLLSPLHDILHY